MEYTYELIKPLVVKEEVSQGQIVCDFKVPGSGKIVKAACPIQRSTATTDSVTRIVKDGLKLQAQYTLRNVMLNVFGGNMIGWTAYRVTDQVTNDAVKPYAFTRKEIEPAIVGAFMTVADQFNFDERSGKWSERTKLAPMVQNLLSTPITNGYDREVLARMMVEVAKADNGLSSDERDFLEGFLPYEMIDEYALHPPLTAAEVAAVSQNVRENMFALTTATVLSDHISTENEKQKLVQFAKMLQLNSEQVARCVRSAKFFTLEAAIPYIGAYPETVYALADKMKMDRSEAEQFLIEYKKRTL